jgi:hypothetical protein
MTSVFAVSYGLLCLLVSFEAMMLRAVLRDTVLIKRVYRDRGHRIINNQLAIGTPAPKFAAPILGARTTVKTTQLKGRTTILLFLSPTETSSPRYQNVAASIHALWHKAQGNLYVVCSGQEQQCRSFVRDYRVKRLEHRIPVILDSEFRVAKGFLISTTPQAVILDSEARVRRYGHLSSKEEIEEMVAHADRAKGDSYSRETEMERLGVRKGAGNGT